MDIACREQKTRVIRDMFQGISGRYDLMNRLMTFGQDQNWRRYTVEKASLPPGGRLLDVGAGTGSLALAALENDPTLRVTAADVTFQMMAVGRTREGTNGIFWAGADALHLPFPDATFDAVASAYLVRNVSIPEQAFEEQVRVVRPGGRVVCLDTSPPPPNVLRPLVLIYLRFGIPLLGHLITGHREAYEYLPSSTRAFMNPETMAAVMARAGLKDVEHRRFMLGTQVVASGTRP
jgi:demethylmenaquinone methyltransferase/2-methoxy-6-polyprenyl-1,4-benzoquinol methylase